MTLPVPHEASFACVICGGPAARWVAATEQMFGMGGSFPYAECARCGCVQLAEVPLDLGSYYPADKYYSYDDSDILTPAASGESWSRKYLRRLKHSYFIFGRPHLLGPLLGRYSPPAGLARLRSLFQGVAHRSLRTRVLDVGCGRGAELARLSEVGFTELHGVDPFLPSTEPPAPHVTLHRATVGELPADMRFDLIMMNHSLEHLPDQRATLLAIAQRLAPGGVVRIEVPTAGSTAWQTYGAQWIELDAPRHLFLHTVQSMEMLAAQAGLRLQGTEPLATPFEFWGSELYQSGQTLYDPATKRVRWLEGTFTSAEAAHYRSLADRANTEGRPGRRLFRLRHANVR